MGLFKKLLSILYLFGFDIKKLLSSLKGLPFFLSDYIKVRRQLKINSDFKLGRLYPILNERNTTSGIMKGAYFHQDLLVAKKIFLNNPEKHIDIGSRIDGFVAHIAVFRKIEVFDIRQQTSTVDNISCKQIDFMNPDMRLLNYCDSVSSLHAIEHFGLGRYGDPIDLNGHVKAIENIFLMLKPSGRFYFSAPIGKQRIEFNAHRIFSVKYLVDLFRDKFLIYDFSYIDEKGDLYENVPLADEFSLMSSFNSDSGVGIFELIKN